MVEDELLSRRIRRVILDIDGTLLASNEANVRSWARGFARAAAEMDSRLQAVTPDAIRARIGMGGDQLIPAVTRDCIGEAIPADSSAGRLASRVHTEDFRERELPHLTALPGARELVRLLQKLGVQLVVATSAKEEEASGLLERAGLDRLLPDRVTRSEVARSKPAPDVIQAALERLGGGPALLIGDTPYDIESARQLGVPTIALRSGGFDDASLKRAVAIYDGPDELAQALRQGLERAA